MEFASHITSLIVVERNSVSQLNFYRSCAVNPAISFNSPRETKLTFSRHLNTKLEPTSISSVLFSGYVMTPILRAGSIFVASGVLLGVLLFTYQIRNAASPKVPKSEPEVSRKKRVKKRFNLDDLWNTTLFFPDYHPEKEDSTTSQLVWYLDDAICKIDVCVYFINCEMLEAALIRQASKGLRIRIIMDPWQSGDNTRLKQCTGIEMRSKVHKKYNPHSSCPNDPVDLMHHKFAVIDDQAILTGSLNWTWSGIQEQFNNVTVTSNVDVIQKFQDEFERLWEEGKDRVDAKQ